MKKRWSKEPQLLAEEHSREKECIAYFKSHAVFARLLKGFREKYISYGSFAGSVTLRNLTSIETEDLEGFFQKNFHGQKSVTISAKRFETALLKSRFEGVQPKVILECYFGEELTGKKELETRLQEECRNIFSKMLQEYDGELASEWMKEMQDTKKDSAVYIWKQYRESGQNAGALGEALRLGATIIRSFPELRLETPEYLPVFAAKVTGNPHYFDDGTAEGNFLYQLAVWVLNWNHITIKKSPVFPAIQKQKQYLAVGILRDDISNYAMISGIHVRKKNGELHAGMEGFWKEKDMVQIPLSVIADWEEIECPNNTIYIVENPSVYAMLSQRSDKQCAVMCMNGQPRLSSVLVLDLLAKSQVKVYYAGDFDPEGLLIAQKIRQYYRGPFSYWHMSRADYENSLSKETISVRRKKILRRITDEELQDTTHAVEKSGRAGYQENIWKEYLQ